MVYYNVEVKIPVRKALLPATLVMTVLFFGILLAYLLYEFMPPKQAQPVEKIKTEVVTKEVPVSAPVQKGDLKDIIKTTQNKVVQIETPEGTGSGFLYNDKGDVVTNAHVVGYETKVTIKTSDKKNYEGKVIGRSEHTDIALVRVESLAKIKPLTIKRDTAELGDDVVALGSPLGLQNTVTVGIISGLDRSFSLDPFVYENMYQITAPISPGNSGGPIVSGIDGAVLGINSVKHTTEHIGFSIPIYTVLPTLEKWSKNPMVFEEYQEYYDFEVPEYEGDITEDYDEEYDSDTSYGTDEDYGVEEDESYTDEYQYVEEYPFEEDYPYEEEYQDGQNLIEDEAAAVVDEYYNYINQGDYWSAYELIGGNWKASSPSVEEFAAGYANTLSTSILESSVRMNEDSTYQVDITLEAYESVSTGEQTSTYYMSYVVGYEDGVVKLLGGEMQ